MRHGETNYNVLGLCNDDPRADVHLTERGIRQVEAAARRLREVPIDRIVVSALPRTRETAEIINRHHGVPVTVHTAINDLRTGFDGRSTAEHRRAIAGNPLHTRVNGGETVFEHKQRVMRFFDWLKRQREKTILIVAHEETLKVAVACFRGLSDADMLELSIPNAAVIEFDL